MRASINEIQTQIIDTAAAADDLPVTEILTPDEQQTLGSITNSSRVSPYRAFIYVVAVVIWTVQELWYILQEDIEDRISTSRPFSRGWYNETGLAYQHGQVLPEDGQYDNTNLTLAEIANRKIIAKIATVESSQNGFGVRRMKVANLVNDELVALVAAELDGFQAYMVF